MRRPGCARGLLRRRARGEAGITLLEVLVGVAVLSILVAGLSRATFTATRSSSTINVAERVDALLAAFGEALKNLPYQECAPADGTTYQAAFTANESNLPNSTQRLLQSGNASVAVTAVSYGPGTDCVAGRDGGTQSLAISATVNGRTKSDSIVKRDPSPQSLKAKVVINVTSLSPSDDAQKAFQLSAVNSFSPAGIYRYEWNCGDAPPTTYQSYQSDDSSVICLYTAKSTASTKTVTLTITDNLGVQTSGSATITVLPTSTPPPEPVARIKATPESGTAPLLVSFVSDGPEPPDGSIVKWEWNFGDPASGSAANSVVCTSSSCKDQTHTFNSGGSYLVTLTVTDNWGGTGAISQNISVGAPVVPRPTASFTATPSTGVVAQTVAFNGTASTPPAGGTITNYSWNVDGTTILSGPTPTFVYNTPGTYTVVLTVTASNGSSNNTSSVVTFGPLSPPTQTRQTDARADLPFFRNGNFSFVWTNPARSPGDTVSIEIRVDGTTFICGSVFGSKTREVPANAAGTVQSYVFQLSSSPAGFNGACIWSSFNFQMRTKRVSPTNGTTYSVWTSPSSFTINRL